MFLKKHKKLEEAPLGYWEESSYMLVIPEDATEELLDGIFERTQQLEDVEVIEKHALTVTEPGRMKIKYQEDEYEVGFYPSSFSVPDMYINKNYYFKEEEITKLKQSKASLTIFMKFHGNIKKAYHLQLKLALAMIPNLIGVMDESAEKMLPATWVRMAAESHVVPSANDLFTVQAVSDENGEVWLHTHGLCRCGLTELEVLQSDQEHYNDHYNLISTFASYLIDKNGQFDGSAYIGVLVNRQPVVVTYVSWTKGIQEYKKLTLGDEKDRKNGHNSKTSIIFLYKSEEDEKASKLTKVSEFNELWGDNPLFFISDEETARMKALAMERFHFVKEQFKNKDNHILIKIGLAVDTDYSFEHIWFELLEFKGNKFKAKLTQEPYDVKNMHEGDTGWYTVEDVTDWVIYTKEFAVTPNTAYLLQK